MPGLTHRQMGQSYGAEEDHIKVFYSRHASLLTGLRRNSVLDRLIVYAVCLAACPRLSKPAASVQGSQEHHLKAP